jgi:hypothetical protein
MATNIDKILELISKVATIQQISNGQQPPSTQINSNRKYADKKAQVSENSGEKTNYIYISKEDLAAIFPNLADKLDITKLLSWLTSKAGVNKLLSILENFNIKPVTNTSDNTVKSQDQPSEKAEEPKETDK